MIRRVLELVQGQSFGRGLALGALVGAAIAGSTIWRRWRQAPAGNRVPSSPRDAER